jgi:serine phosphatase RsbU (regulator of sigma subunit)
VERQDWYLAALAELEDRTRSADPHPDLIIEGAAGLLAGRIGGRIDHARARILQLASEQGRPPHAVASQIRAVLENPTRPDACDRNQLSAEDVLRAAGEPPRRQLPASTPPSSDPDREAHIVQQILDTGVGRHLFLIPVADDAGTVIDYRIAAASPSVVDLAGRNGAQLVGRTLSELYPWLVDGPIWQAWRQVVADGRPRDVGPTPYRADIGPGQVALTITAHARPIGRGLLTTWTRQDEEGRLAERLRQMERLGHLGWVEWDLINDSTMWSDGMYRIFDRNPADGPLPRGTVETWTLPADQPLLRQAAQSFGRGEATDVVTRVRVHGYLKHLRTVADAVRDDNGRPLKVYGIVQDLTAQEVNRSRLAEAEEQLREHQRTLAAEHRLAAQLQHIILPIPAEPVDLPGLRVAVRYLPAERASRVGGDWFHAATARDGTVILAVGDVSGHGVQAAATMAQLRYAVAALAATITAEPAELLSHLNDLLYHGGLTAPTATMVIARYDPGTATLRWAQAGHPSPLHSRNGTTCPLARPTGPLLGAVHNARYDTTDTRLIPGDVLLFYTDGLIEHRHRPLLDGLAPVISTLDRITANPRSQPLAQLLAELHQANPDDDTCLLAARPIGNGGTDRASDRPRPMTDVLHDETIDVAAKRARLEKDRSAAEKEPGTGGNVGTHGVTDCRCGRRG